ncbi:MAG: WG repeat-containing protein [Saprospiraceae bacterium]|nr:WG repeat-containing protein [Saprospiraceae bacterium]
MKQFLTIAGMRIFATVCLLQVAGALPAQQPAVLEEQPRTIQKTTKPPAPAGYAYNDYGQIVTAQQAYWSELGSHYTRKFSQNGKNGMKAQDGTVLIPAEYDDLHFQYCGFMVASKEGKFGVINETNKAVIPFEYKRLELLYKPLAFQVPKGVPLEDLRLLATRDDGQSGLLNGKGELVFPFRENRYVQVAYFYPAARTTQGYVTAEQPDYQSAMRQTALIYHQPDEKGIVAMDGKILLPFEYATIDVSYGTDERPAQHPEWVQVCNADNACGIFDMRRRAWMIEPKFYGGIALMQASPPLFTTQAETEPDEHGVTYTRYGVIDSTGRTVLPFEYLNFGLTFVHQSKLHIWAQKMGKWGVVDIDNKMVTPFEHPKVIQHLKMERGPHFSLKDPVGEFFGVLSLEGKLVVPLKYKWLGDHNGHLIIFVNEQMKCGLVNDQGREVLPGIYTDIQLLRHGFFYINAESKLGLVDPSGKILAQPTYRGAYLENTLPAFSGDFKAKGIPEAEVVTVLTREDGAAVVVLKNGKMIGLD